MPNKEQYYGSFQQIGRGVQKFALLKNFGNQHKEQQHPNQGVVLVQTVEKVQLIVNDFRLYLVFGGQYLLAMIFLVLLERFQQTVRLGIIPAGNRLLQRVEIVRHRIPNEIGIERILELVASTTIINGRNPFVVLVV